MDIYSLSYRQIFLFSRTTVSSLVECSRDWGEWATLPNEAIRPTTRSGLAATITKVNGVKPSAAKLKCDHLYSGVSIAHVLLVLLPSWGILRTSCSSTRAAASGFKCSRRLHLSRVPLVHPNSFHHSSASCILRTPPTTATPTPRRMAW